MDNLLPIFFGSVIAIVRDEEGATVVHFADGRKKISKFSPVTMRKRYYTLIGSARKGQFN